MALSLVSMPETFEQWASWGPVEAASLDGKLQRIGLNFGAPGDRVTHDGTLWVAVPKAGGPSPDVRVTTEPAAGDLETFYQHSLFLKGGSGWPWVAGSGVIGVRLVTLSGLKPGVYSVRLTFSEPGIATKPGARVFSITINGMPVAESFDPVTEVKGVHRAVTVEVGDQSVDAAGALRIELDAKAGLPVISGIEVVRKGLKMAPVSRL